MPLNIASWLFISHAHWGGVAAGPAIFLLMAAMSVHKDHEQTRMVLAVLGVGALLYGPGAIIWWPLVVDALEATHRWPPGQIAAYGQPMFGWLLWGAAGVGLWWLIFRYMAKKREAFRQRLLAKTDARRTGKTDIRTVAELLPKPTGDYDPVRHFRKGQIFLGLDEAKKAVLIPYELFRRCHIQLMGTTGAGKGVAAGLMMVQALREGEAVVIFDPKNDEWAPHLMRQEAERLGKPFVLVDLKDPRPQINLLATATPAEVQELVIAGLGLADKGDGADHYRGRDRKAARALTRRILEGNDSATLADMAEAAAADEEFVNQAEGLVNKLEEVATVAALSAVAGVNLAELLEEGGCLYVVGSMRNAEVLACQRMMLVRVMQLVERRDRLATKPRQVLIFLDEVKALISKPALEMLGAIRDKGAHLVLAHQALADLRDAPADLDKEAVVGAVVENCAIRIVYKIQETEARTWVAEMTGKILVDDELRAVESSGALVEQMTGHKTLRQDERPQVDENMIQALPDRVGIIFTPGAVRFGHMCPIKTEKRPLEPSLGRPRPSLVAHVPRGKGSAAKPPKTKETTPAQPAAEPDLVPWAPYDEELPNVDL